MIRGKVIVDFDEIWKPIKDYEGLYEVSNKGNIRSIERTVIESSTGRKKPVREKLVSFGDNGNGYKFCYLWKNNKSKRCYVHRLVAETFIPNPNNLPQVNHKNLDKTDNSVNNLEWISDIDNKIHYKGMLIEDDKGNIYKGRKELAKALNISDGRLKWYFETRGYYEHNIDGEIVIFKPVIN